MTSKEANHVTIQERPATQAGKTDQTGAKQHANLQRLGHDLAAPLITTKFCGHRLPLLDHAV